MCTLLIDLSIVMSNLELIYWDKLEFRHMACSGHTACPGHTGILGTEHDVQVMDSDLGHGVCVHVCASTSELSLKFTCI